MKIKNGVKKKICANPTNWKFDERDEDKRAENKLPPVCSIKSKFAPVYDQIYGNCTSNAALACDHYYYHPVDKPWIPSTTFTYYNQQLIYQF